MNFKINRIFAVVMRHLLAIVNPFELGNQLYWVLLDIVTFGFLIKSINKSDTGTLDVTAICLLTNLAVWYILPRASIEMAKTLLRDLDNSSFVGLIATPLTIFEWIMAQIVIAMFCSATNFAMGFICIKFLFGFNVFSVGFVIIPVIISLLVSSWILGIFLLSFLMFFGKKASMGIYSMPWMLVTFSGVFYSIDILPKFCQRIAYGIPTFYVFDGLTQFIKNGTSISSAIIKSMELNIFYFIISLVALVVMFKASKKAGLTRLELEG